MSVGSNEVSAQTKRQATERGVVSHTATIFLIMAATVTFCVAGWNVYSITKYKSFWHQQQTILAELKLLAAKENSKTGITIGEVHRAEDKMQAQFASYQQQISILLAISAIVFTIFSIAMPIMNHRMDKDFAKRNVEDLQKEINEKLEQGLRVVTSHQNHLLSLVRAIAYATFSEPNAFAFLPDDTIGLFRDIDYFLKSISATDVEQERLLSLAIEIDDKNYFLFKRKGQACTSAAEKLLKDGNRIKAAEYLREAEKCFDQAKVLLDEKPRKSTDAEMELYDTAMQWFHDIKSRLENPEAH